MMAVCISNMWELSYIFEWGLDASAPPEMNRLPLGKELVFTSLSKAPNLLPGGHTSGYPHLWCVLLAVCVITYVVVWTKSRTLGISRCIVVHNFILLMYRCLIVSKFYVLCLKFLHYFSQIDILYNFLLLFVWYIIVTTVQMCLLLK